MQQLPDDREASLAAAAQRLEQIHARIPVRNQRMDRLQVRLLANQEAPAQRLEPTLARIVGINQRADQLQARLLAALDRPLAIQEAIANLLEQVIQQRDSTRRLWLFLAKLHGWPEEELGDTQTDTPT